jgi:hypothetical protein
MILDNFGESCAPHAAKLLSDGIWFSEMVQRSFRC